MLSRWPVYERVLANLDDGTALDGVLTKKSGPLLILADTILYVPGAEPTRLDGDVYIERGRVLFLQKAPVRNPTE